MTETLGNIHYWNIQLRKKFHTTTSYLLAQQFRHNGNKFLQTILINFVLFKNIEFQHFQFN